MIPIYAIAKSCGPRNDQVICKDGWEFDLLDLPPRSGPIREIATIHRDPNGPGCLSRQCRLVDMTLSTADKKIHQYPVKTLW